MAVPVSLKAISPYLKTAQEYDKRDPVVAYYCKYSLKYFFWCCEVFSVKTKMEAKGETGNINFYQSLFQRYMLFIAMTFLCK